MKKLLSYGLTLSVLLFLSACTTPDMGSPFGKKVKKEYFTGGALKSELILDDASGQNGVLKQYGYNGKLTSTVQMHNGVKDGMETLYDGHGRVLRLTPYINGRKNGVLKVLYPNGDILAAITYKNNTKDGKAVKYNKDGSINEQAMFQHGKRID